MGTRTVGLSTGQTAFALRPAAAHTAIASACVAAPVVPVTSSLAHTEPAAALQPVVVVEQQRMAWPAWTAAQTNAAGLFFGQPSTANMNAGGGGEGGSDGDA